jgi:hypothetical protein
MFYEKQFIISKLKLPLELTDVVKSYLFYDIVTGNKIKSYKLYKNKLIEEVNFSLKCGYVNGWWGSYLSYKLDEEDTDEDEPYDNSICSGENCLKCGNFKNISYNDNLYDILPEKIICNC